MHIAFAARILVRFLFLNASLVALCLSPSRTWAEDPDQDRDGISDLYEHELAEVLAPVFVFDSRENSRAPDEPLTLYQVHPLPAGHSSDPKVLSVVLTYAYLFRWDGGYPLSLFCDDEHAGDNERLRLRVDIHEEDPMHPRVRGLSWRGEWIGPPLVQLEAGGHPRIYLSAGKHHPSPRIWFEPSVSPFSAWQCRDGNNGFGDEVPAVVTRQGLRLNVGERAHPLITDLTALGIPDEDAWGSQPFCGGLQNKLGRAACRATSTRSNRELWVR